jgi:putative ABC transport system permease protein
LTNKLVLENLRHRPVRTLLSVIAVGVQVTMMLTLVGVSRGMLEDTTRRAQGVGADIMIKGPNSSLMSFSAANLPEKAVDYFRERPHVTGAFGTIIQSVGGIDTITGVNLDEFSRMSGGFKYLKGGPFRTPDDVIVDEYYAKQKKLSVGSVLNLVGRAWHVVGIVEPGKMAHVVVPLKSLQEQSNPGKISQVWLKIEDPDAVQKVIAELKATPELANYGIWSVRELTSLYSVDSVPALKAFIYVVVGLSVVVGFLVVFLSLYTAVLERTREIGILKALGASPAYIVGMLMRETAMLALIGWVLGIGFSYLTRWIIMTLIPASLPQIIVFSWWPISGAIALSGALLGAMYPGLKAARQDAIEALSYE